jgi:methionine-rich copper-binding protein CopC
VTSRTRRTGRRSGARPRRWPAALLAGLLLALTGLFATAGPADAASLNNSSPSAGAKLSSAPGAVRLTFTTLVLLGTASVSVTGPGGSVTEGGVQVFGLSVTQNLRSGLGPGTYSVSWRIAGLLHSDSGGYSFTVASPAGSTGGGAKPKPTRSKPAKPKPTAEPTPTPNASGTPTPTPTPTASGTPTPAVTGTTAAMIPVGTPSATPSYEIAESAPNVQGVGSTGSGKVPSPPVIWGLLMLLAVGGWVFFRVRRGNV